MIDMSKCVICGRLLNEAWKTKCWDCWKRTEFPKKDIKDIMSRLGENSIAGKKNWHDLQIQKEEQSKNYKGRS
jgi:hypothetical protein